MCGNVGFSGKTEFDLDKIKILTYINSIERGLDATGSYTPKNGLQKTLQDGCSLSVGPKFTLVPDKSLMLHVRAATVGKKDNVNNAHPFMRGDYVLQHNGTLKNYIDLIEKYKLNIADYNVDSDVICGALEKCGDFKSVLEDIDGPAAIIMTKKSHPHVLYVYRNFDRPLFHGKLNGCLYISSVEESLKLINCIDVKEFKINNLYTIDDGFIVNTKKIKNIPYYKPKVVNNTKFDNNEKTGCLIKPTNSLNLITNRTEIFKLDKNKYYEIIEIYSHYAWKIKDLETKETVTISSLLLNDNTRIKKNDYAIFVENTKDDYYDIVFEKGSIALIEHLYYDDSVSVKTIAYPKNNNKPQSFIVPKCTLRKLDASELEYYSEETFKLSESKAANKPVSSPLPDTDKETTLKNNQEFLNSLLLNGELVTEEEDGEEPKDIIVNENDPLGEDNDDKYNEIQLKLVHFINDKINSFVKITEGIYKSSEVDPSIGRLQSRLKFLSNWAKNKDKEWLELLKIIQFKKQQVES